jgi:hypothetical protein
MGITIETQKGQPWSVLVFASFLCSTVMVITIEFFFLVDPNFKLSAFTRSGQDPALPFMIQGLIAFIWVASIAGTLVACLSRGVLLAMLKYLFNDGGNLEHIESRINLLIKIVGAIGLLIAALASGD